MEEGTWGLYYQSYNSVISDGRRVRRMRRTELSAEKIRNNSSKKTETYHNNSKHKSATGQSSLAKIEPRRNKDKYTITQNLVHSAQVQYYNNSNHKDQPRNTSAHRDYSRGSRNQKSGERSGRIKVDISRRSANGTVQQMSVDSSRILNSTNKKIQLPNPNQNPKNPQTNKSNLSHSQNSQNSQQKLKPPQPPQPPQLPQLSITQKNSQNQPHYDNPSKQINKSVHNSISRNSSRKSEVYGKVHNGNVDQGGVEAQNKGLDQYGLGEGRGSKIKGRSNHGSKINSSRNQGSHVSNSSKLNLSKQSSKSKPKQMVVNQPQPSAFKEVDQIFSKEESNLGEEVSNISKVKVDQLTNPIINSSSAQKQSWKDAIKSLTYLQSQIHQSQSSQQPNQNTRNANQQKKLSLQIDSMRQDNLSTDNRFESTNKNSWKNLPLASRQPSQRKSYDSLGSKVEPGSLRNVLDCIQFHQYLVSMVEEFREETEQEHQSQDAEILCFLLAKKHFLQKSNMIKALKGGKNIFRLSTIQIQTNILKQYLQHEQILKLLKQYQLQNRQLFKNLQKTYLQLKPRHKSNPYLKLQTPNDTFSKQIARILKIQLLDLQEQLKSGLKEEQEIKIETRIFKIMEIVFLMSQFSGRNVKNIQFQENVQDFQEYYHRNQQALWQTFQYFSNLK